MNLRRFARILDFPGFAVAERTPPADLPRVDLYYDPVSEVWIEWNESIAPPGYPYFPYGEMTLPD